MAYSIDMTILRVSLQPKDFARLNGAVNPDRPRNTWNAIRGCLNERCDTSALVYVILRA